jgi:hypothetical protein
MRTRLRRSRFRLAGVLVALLVALGAVAALASGAPTAHQARAALVLTSRHPATVRGTGFKPKARVRVTLLEGQTQVRRPLTNSSGTFTTSFSMVIDRCSVWSITASQPGHAPVVLHGPAKPECAPAGTP